MNNEPVAYFAKNKQGWWAETDKETGIPFYTHPVNTCKHGVDDGACKECYQEVIHPVEEQDESFDRTASHMAGEYVFYKAELTDEEILDLCPPNHSDMMNEAYTIEFARAILRKAQEVEAKYVITTKWDGITTYHETTEPIGKAQEK